MAKFSDLSNRSRVAAANVATQMGGGTTTAEVAGFAEVMKVLSLRPDLAHPILMLCDQSKTLPSPG